MNNFEITKILNNNVVQCTHIKSLKKVLVYGKGIGFNKHLQETIDENIIEKIYEINDIKIANQYENLLIDIEEDILEVTEEIISKMSEKLSKDYNERVHVSLLDHISFAVKRYKQNLTVDNIFNDEMKFMYSVEYEFSEEMVKIINEKLNIKLPESEAGFICMHIHSALNKTDLGINSTYVLIIKDSIEIIKKELDVEFISEDISWQRFAIHVKFAIKRCFDGIMIKNPLTNHIKKSYVKTYNCALKIALNIGDNYGLTLNDDEICYLAMHIQNIKERINENVEQN